MIILSSSAKDVASHYLSDMIFDCMTLSGDLDAIDSALDTLSNALSIAFRDALLYSVKNVDILRPDDAHNLYLKVDVYNNETMSANPMSGTIDLSNVNDWKYFKALLMNNIEDVEITEVSSDVPVSAFIGT